MFKSPTFQTHNLKSPLRCPHLRFLRSFYLVFSQHAFALTPAQMLRRRLPRMTVTVGTPQTWPPAPNSRSPEKHSQDGVQTVIPGRPGRTPPRRSDPTATRGRHQSGQGAGGAEAGIPEPAVAGIHRSSSPGGAASSLPWVSFACG